MPSKVKNISITKLKTIHREGTKSLNNLREETSKNKNKNKKENNKQNITKNKQKLVELPPIRKQDKENKKLHNLLFKMTDKKAQVNTPNSNAKKFVPLKSATNTNKRPTEDTEIRGSMQRSKSTNDTKTNGVPVKKSTTPSDKKGKKGKDHAVEQHVDMNQLNAQLLPNTNRRLKQVIDTASLTHSIAKETWQQSYKECQRHLRSSKDDNLEKRCSSCNISYVMCEQCRTDQQIPFTSDDTCIDCAPSVCS